VRCWQCCHHLGLVLYLLGKLKVDQTLQLVTRYALFCMPFLTFTKNTNNWNNMYFHIFVPLTAHYFFRKCSVNTVIILYDSQEAHKLLQPVDNTLKTMALEFAEYQAWYLSTWVFYFLGFELACGVIIFPSFQVCVDVFLTTQSYVDIASISVVPQTTGGRVGILPSTCNPHWLLVVSEETMVRHRTLHASFCLVTIVYPTRWMFEYIYELYNWIDSLDLSLLARLSIIDHWLMMSVSWFLNLKSLMKVKVLFSEVKSACHEALQATSPCTGRHLLLG